MLFSWTPTLTPTCTWAKFVSASFQSTSRLISTLGGVFGRVDRPKVLYELAAGVRASLLHIGGPIVLSESAGNFTV